ncbi:MAG: site-2 protease family protein [Acidobacteria bacterium]|nr:site-2 protease family protein [Acidobacteriota bacterium]
MKEEPGLLFPSPDKLGPSFDLTAYQSVSYLQREKKNIIRAGVLLLITLFTATLAGFFWDIEFRYATTGILIAETDIWQHPQLLLRGLPYAGGILFILLSHEMGHFLVCRYYRLHSTPPFPIPFPAGPAILSFGTLGAVIKIKQPFRNRRQLFDVGIGGPLAGMVAAIPVYLAGFYLSAPSVVEPRGLVLVFGDNLLTYLGIQAFFSDGVASHAIALHPLGWAAFFGFVATSLNLLPIGQLDGGHIVYALFGPRGHRVVSFVFFIVLTLNSIIFFPSYLLFALILIVLRLRHPPTLFDDLPVSRSRRILAVVALIIFLCTFIPDPISIQFFE